MAKYTDELKQEIKEFYKTHTKQETFDRYALNGLHKNTIHRWIDSEYNKKERDRNRKARAKISKENKTQNAHKWYTNNKELIKQRNKERDDRLGDLIWRKQNKGYLKDKIKKWRHENKERIKKYRNQQHIKKKHQERVKFRKQIDFKFKILESCRIQLCSYVKRSFRKNENLHTKDLIGCTLEELSDHLRKQYQPGMLDENHGSIWHIDHKIPCSSFDFSDIKQVHQCFHYTNLQPLFVLDNIKKSNKILCPENK